jgi:hypothetical protein
MLQMGHIRGSDQAERILGMVFNVLCQSRQRLQERERSLVYGECLQSPAQFGAGIFRWIRGNREAGRNVTDHENLLPDVVVQFPSERVHDGQR